MATHDQINKNVDDVQSAWGWVRYVINAALPSAVSDLNRATRLAKIRRNYR